MTDKKQNTRQLLEDCGFDTTKISAAHVDALDKAFNALEKDSVPLINKPSDQQLDHIIAQAKKQGLFDENDASDFDFTLNKKSTTSILARPIPSYALALTAVFSIIVGYGVRDYSSNSSLDGIYGNQSKVYTAINEQSVTRGYGSSDALSGLPTRGAERAQVLGPPSKQEQLIKILIESRTPFDYSVSEDSGFIAITSSEEMKTILKTLQIDFTIDGEKLKVKTSNQLRLQAQSLIETSSPLAVTE